MKRNIIAFFLAINFVFGIYGQNSSQTDIILLLDTSSAMSSSFDNVNNYITGTFLSEFLRIGDTFHLITFSGASKLDAARRINSRGDIETIIGRMLLQYPVESGSDTGAAISHAEQYISSLPARPKKVVMISVNDASAQVNAAKPRFTSKNATLDFVSVVPGQALTNLPSSGRSKPAGSSAPAAPAAAQTPPAAPQASTPAAPQTSAPAATAPAATQARSTPQASAPAAAQTSPAAPQASTPAAPQTSAPAATTPAATQARSTPQTSAPTAAQTSPAAPQASTPSAPQTSAPAATAPAATQTRSTPQASAPAAAQTSPAAQTSGSGETPAAKEAKEAPVGTGSPDHSGKRVSVKTEKPKKESKLNSSVLMIVGIVILALLVLGLVIFFILRRLGSNPSLVMAEASNDKNQDADQGTTQSAAKKPAQGTAQKPAQKAQQSAAPPTAQFADHSKELASYAAAATKKRSTPYSDRQKKSDNAKPAEINPSGPLLLNLFVEDQNTSIGKRNIHSLKSGYSLSIGGGKSDFLIFLVPMPANIGEIKRNGSECTFIAKKTKYFPDLESGELKNCINKTIRVLSDRNYEMRFRFEMYEDPLIALNRLLHSVKVPG